MDINETVILGSGAWSRINRLGIVLQPAPGSTQDKVYVDDLVSAMLTRIEEMETRIQTLEASIDVHGHVPPT